MISEAYFQHILTCITYVLPNSTNCIDYRLVSWRNWYVAHFESSLEMFRPILFMDEFSLNALYLSETVPWPTTLLVTDFIG